MNCRDTQRKMSAYLDGELTAAERIALFDHLQGCAECRDVIGEASFFEAAIAGTLKQRMESPASIRYGVMNAIAREKAERAPVVTWIPVWQRFAWRPAAAFAAVLALAGAGWRTFTQVVEPAPTSVESQAPRMAALPAPAKHEVPAPPERPAPRPAVRHATTAPPAHHARVRSNAAPQPAVRPEPARKPAQTPAERTRTTTAPLATPAPAAPAPSAPPAPTMVAANPIDNTVGTVSYVWTPDNVMNGRFLSRRNAKTAWEEASYDLQTRTHLQTRESTVIEMTLKDGTQLKSNENTEFVVQRAPGKEDASWGIRLVRGELWVQSKPGIAVEIVAPGATVKGTGAEFSVRSFDGEDATAMVVSGQVTCANALGSVDVTSGSATVAVPGEAPEASFAAADISGHLEWAYRLKNAYNALDNGGLSH